MNILSSPVYYTLELTSNCNNRCYGCGNVCKGNPAYLTALQWKKIIRKIANPHVSLRISGGEPTQHPQFVEIIEFIQEIGIPFVLFSNGMWADPGMLIRLLKKSDDFMGMMISVHGDTPELHDSFTGVDGSFNESANNIRRVAASGIHIATNTIMTKHNCERIGSIIPFIQSLGVRQGVFSRFIPVQDGSILPDRDQLKRAVRIIELQKGDFPFSFSVCIPQCFANSSSNGCLSGVAYCVIDPVGNVRPCAYVPLICGNLLNQPLEEIWNSSEMNQWRSIMIPHQCMECHALSVCHGGCKAAAIHAKQKKDPLIGGPITEERIQSDKIFALHPEIHPKRTFSFRKENFGYILVDGFNVIPVSDDSIDIIQILDGSVSLRSIEKSHGKEVLDFIGFLFEKGMVVNSNF